MYSVYMYVGTIEKRSAVSTSKYTPITMYLKMKVVIVCRIYSLSMKTNNQFPLNVHVHLYLYYDLGATIEYTVGN